WSLTEAGARLLTTFDGFGTLPARLRSHEPTVTFLEHTLAVAEACLTLSEAVQHGQFEILDLQREPDCWRAYSAPHGGMTQLKPDLALVTASGEYEDHWFLEIDRDTEPPSRVVRACLRYEEYRRSGVEQRAIEVFPAVVWVVPDSKRAATLKRHMSSEPRLSRAIFTVVTIEDLPTVISAGMGAQEPGDAS
ncbi:MAG: replication-relaxation family protein, partial [Coriobacteriia bacterium]|nr:replication-relaxation family protein [Coriobacteriia bacterium]